MKEFSEDCKFDWPLTPDSIVLDCGGYEGNWGRLMMEKHNCRVYILEPVFKYFYRIARDCDARLNVLPFGIGAKTRFELFGVNNDSSGIYALRDKSDEALILSVSDLLKKFTQGQRFSCIKLNIEGMEYETLEAILNNGLATRFDALLVQFHRIAPNADARREAIISRLSATHELIFDEPWVWTGWRLKQ